MTTPLDFTAFMLVYITRTVVAVAAVLMFMLGIGSQYVIDNNLLPASEGSNGADVNDYYRLEQKLVPIYEEGFLSLYSLQIREFEHEHTYLDTIKLFAVDHDPNIKVGVTLDGQILTYEDPVPPISAVNSRGENVLTPL